jgi:anti-sigma28 factor (negative regulator of flagellin synthesis)
MKRTNLPSKTKLPLNKNGKSPISELSFMQISSFSASFSTLPTKTMSSSSPTPQPSADQAQTHFSTSATSFSGLVQQAGQMPEVRSEVVDSFKSRIQAGQYPTPDTMDNLTDVIGNGIVQMADSASE